jgi:hypothetical protein
MERKQQHLCTAGNWNTLNTIPSFSFFGTGVKLGPPKSKNKKRLRALMGKCYPRGMK